MLFWPYCLVWLVAVTQSRKAEPSAVALTTSCIWVKSWVALIEPNFGTYDISPILYEVGLWLVPPRTAAIAPRSSCSVRARSLMIRVFMVMLLEGQFGLEGEAFGLRSMDIEQNACQSPSRVSQSM